MLVDRHGVRQAVRALGLGQQPLCVHASFRSFGGVSGGPEAVVDGLLDEGCTVLVPTFSWGYAVPPPPGLRPARNGWPADRSPDTAGIGRVYGPRSRELDQDMGAVAAAILDRPEHVRGQHPLCSFTAVGPQAQLWALGRST
jgi:aminoglycoside N3'-acetyltransferase